MSTDSDLVTTPLEHPKSSVLLADQPSADEKKSSSAADEEKSSSAAGEKKSSVLLPDQVAADENKSSALLGPEKAAEEGPEKAAVGGCRVSMNRLSAGALISLWGGKMRGLNLETDILEARLNAFMRNKPPQINNRLEQYVWSFPVPGNPDPQIIDRCVERINHRNQLPEEQARWSAHNSSTKLQKSITVAIKTT